MPQDVRFVIFHTPGPAWLMGKDMFEQPGVRAHVAHYRQWLESDRLLLGGPHLDAGSGGMMIPVAGIPEDEVRQIAAADPAVHDGTLIAEVRPWLIGMRGEAGGWR
ncbi:YciI family protein [Agromyces sp. NPDC056523]|uniref:YciI family protein n=1 Tax=Agromyces sp. NPDC056523 TaxID=3345850 RepID=UPI0036729A2B